MSEHQGGSLALIGGRLRTLTATDAGATALLVRDGRIAALGSDAEIAASARAAGLPVRELGGATVTPGLFDSHTHPLWAAEITAGVDLGGLSTLDEIRAALAAAHASLPPDAWLRGWNLEYEPFAATGMRGELFADAIGDRPTVLMCYDLHTALASPTALAAAGVTGARVFDDTSEIVVDRDGLPTGELREPSAYQLVFDAAPRPSHAAERDALRDMFRRLAATGLTGGAIMDGNERTVELLAELEARGELDHRVTVHHWHAVKNDDAAIARVITAATRRGRLWQTGAIKLFSDGVIDTGTAWLHAPDARGEGRGGFWPNWERFAAVVQAYHDAGLLIATHAVGDRAVARVLDVYAGLPPRDGLPFHSIEHLEVLSDADVEALRSSGVTASMQPLHMQWREPDGSDNWAERLGDRAATGFRVRSVRDAGVRLTLGSDWPVAHYDPRVGMAWARGRHRPGDPHAHVFEPEERLTAEDALAAYTRWPAEARGHADRGVLAPGAVADLTVWGSDPVAATPDELPDVPIHLTVVDGRVVFEA